MNHTSVVENVCVRCTWSYDNELNCLGESMFNYKKFIVAFPLGLVIFSILGAFSCWDVKMFYFGNWEDIPRGLMFTFNLLFSGLLSMKDIVIRL